MEKICLSLRFHLKEGENVGEVVPKLPRPPDDVWKQFQRNKTDGFAYTKDFPGSRLLDDDKLLLWLEEAEDLWPLVAAATNDVPKCELSIDVYVKNETRMRLPSGFVARLAAMSCHVNIDIFNVGE